MWVEFNNNPVGRKVGDCAIRAVSLALGVDWEEAYALIAANGYMMGDMPSSNAVFGSVLRQHGFYRAAVPNKCPDCYTAEDFCKDHPEGTYVLIFNGHTACVIDGDIYDSWDSSLEVVDFYWYKKDGEDDQ